MSLPGCQQRVLNHIEGALHASDPQLAAMYAVFTRLNAGAGAPVGAEPLARRRLPNRRAAACAAVLVPVMFAIIIIATLLSSSARGATTCGVGTLASRGVQWVSRASCTVRKTTEIKSSQSGAPQSGQSLSAREKEAVTGSAGASCTARMRGLPVASGAC